MLGKLFEHLAAVGATSRPVAEQEVAYREIDRKLEGLIATWVVEEDEAAIRSELKSRFGISCFGDQPLNVLKRVMRRKRIETEDEAKLVQDFLSGDYLGWTAGETKLKKFSELLAAYDYRKR